MVGRPAAAIAAWIAALMLVTSACTANGPQATDATPRAQDSSGTSPPTALPHARQPEDIEGARTYKARPFPDWVTVAAGTAWVANIGEGVARYDADTGRPLGSVGPGLEVCTGMDSGYRSLWVADCPTGRLFRFDLESGEQLASIDLPVSSIQEEGSVAAGGDGVYVVAAGGAEIVRVDPRTNNVADRLPAPGAAGVRCGFGSLWVTSPTLER